jgi:hypothetical protein
VFVSGKVFHASLKLASMVGGEHVMMPKFMGMLQALPSNNRLTQESLPFTNALAYNGSASVKKRRKHFVTISQLVAFLRFSCQKFFVRFLIFALLFVCRPIDTWAGERIEREKEREREREREG